MKQMASFYLAAEWWFQWPYVERSWKVFTTVTLEKSSKFFVPDRPSTGLDMMTKFVTWWPVARHASKTETKIRHSLSTR
jgi:hypothetical protein